MVEPLLPIRHPNSDWFICDFGEVIPKSDIASMEHPLFTLSTKPDTKIRHYEHNNNTVTIAPSALGMATIHDKDILIYCISQLMTGINKGKEPQRKIRFKAHDLLVATNRQTSGQGYKLLRNALDRLAGTLITTDIKTNDTQIIEGFGIIDRYKIVVKDKKINRMVELEVTLSEWLYNSILGKEILSINSDYFRLRKPIERRIYEIARKHCGRQKAWKIELKNLHKKVGTASTVAKFKFTLKHMVEHQHLPDYSLKLDNNTVLFSYTGERLNDKPKNESPNLQLTPHTIENAKAILKGQYDVYALEAEWREWSQKKGEVLKNPDGAFINFCKRRIANS